MQYEKIETFNPTITNVVPPATPMYPALRDRILEARGKTPKGCFHVDADALRKARAATPVGEFHQI